MFGSSFKYVMILEYLYDLNQSLGSYSVTNIKFLIRKDFIVCFIVSIMLMKVILWVWHLASVSSPTNVNFITQLINTLNGILKVLMFVK